MKTLWIASTNKGKLTEFRQLLEGHAEVHSVAELSFYSPPPEIGKTFEENARIKARTLKAIKPKTWVVADDSGLEVEGLGGLPGIHSARYAGDKASDSENNAKLIKMVDLRTSSLRKARFRCVLVAYDPDGKEYVVEGVLDGQIALRSAGQTGFGYDPVFVPSGHQQTLAELGLAAKNQMSHRSQAIRELLRLIQPEPIPKIP